jgi:hypothetical protein
MLTDSRFLIGVVVGVAAVWVVHNKVRALPGAKVAS